LFHRAKDVEGSDGISRRDEMSAPGVKKREDASSSSHEPAFDSRRAVEHKDKPIHLRIVTNIFAFEIGSCSATDLGALAGLTIDQGSKIQWRVKEMNVQKKKRINARRSAQKSSPIHQRYVENANIVVDKS
jgi:hypothetical protein